MFDCRSVTMTGLFHSVQLLVSVHLLTTPAALDSIGERKVKIYTTRSNFDRAEAVCLADKMHLMMVTSEEEHKVACNALTQMNLPDA